MKTQKSYVKKDHSFLFWCTCLLLDWFTFKSDSPKCTLFPLFQAFPLDNSAHVILHNSIFFTETKKRETHNNESQKRSTRESNTRHWHAVPSWVYHAGYGKFVTFTTSLDLFPSCRTSCASTIWAMIFTHDWTSSSDPTEVENRR